MCRLTICLALLRVLVLARTQRLHPPSPRACSDTSRTCTSAEFDREFRLRCDAEAIVPRLRELLGKRRVRGVMHVGTNDRYGAWRTVLWDQLATLRRCGVLNVTHVLDFSVVGPADARALADDVKRDWDGSHFRGPHVRTTPSLKASVPWEEDAVRRVRDECERDPTAFVFYLHTKGTSHFVPDWPARYHQRVNSSYAHSLYWRKMMEYFL